MCSCYVIVGSLSTFSLCAVIGFVIASCKVCESIPKVNADDPLIDGLGAFLLLLNKLIFVISALLVIAEAKDDIVLIVALLHSFLPSQRVFRVFLFKL